MTSDPRIIGLLLLAALIHASWNAVAKTATDKRHLYLVSNLTTGAIASMLVLILPLPARESWPYILVSGPIQAIYTVVLLAAYRVGDLGQIYPILRGLSPLLVALGAALFAGEQPSTQQYAGIGIVSLGIASLAFGGGGRGTSADRRPLLYCLVGAVFVATYTVIDGIGVRRSGAPVAYAAWLWVSYAVGAILCYPLLGRWKVGTADAGGTVRAIGIGVGMLASYGAIIYALNMGMMAYVSALRETSVIIAAVIGSLFLGEPFGRLRIASAALVAMGLFVLNGPTL